MTLYVIKYEDVHGNCHVENYSTWDKQSAITMLKHPVKEIYWIL